MHATESSILTVRPICGGSDPDLPLIVELIAKASMCLPCAASKMGISETRAAEAIERTRSFMVVTIETARCAGCLCVTTTYRVAGERAPANASAPPATLPATPATLPGTPTLNEALWRFLTDRRGKMFCTQCLANALFATKRIDRAMLGAEGRGARRQYGTCASCGKERLLCGLTSQPHAWAAEDVYLAVKRRLPRVSLATVYNALELLVRTGLAGKLTYGDAAARYDIRTDVHSHARCLGCGRVDDVEARPAARWLAGIRTRNFTATGFRFEILGHCRDCRPRARAGA